MWACVCGCNLVWACVCVHFDRRRGYVFVSVWTGIKHSCKSFSLENGWSWWIKRPINPLLSPAPLSDQCSLPVHVYVKRGKTHSLVTNSVWLNFDMQNHGDLQSPASFREGRDWLLIQEISLSSHTRRGDVPDLASCSPWEGVQAQMQLMQLLQKQVQNTFNFNSNMQ